MSKTRTMAEARKLIGKRRQGSQWIITDHTLHDEMLVESSPMCYGAACQGVRDLRAQWLEETR